MSKQKQKLTPIPKRRAAPAPAKSQPKADASPSNTGPDLSHIAPALHSLAVPIGDLQFDPANARLHPEKNLDALRGSLTVYGQCKPVVARKGSGVVIAGNGTLQAALSLGWQSLAVVYVDMDAATAAGYSIADNRTSDLAAWDKDALDKLLREVSTNNDARLDQMLSELATEVGVVPGDASAANADDTPALLELDDDDNPEAELLAPFPWFGGKSRIARAAWKYFGDVKNYCEPFFGSGAMLLNRPLPFEGTETVNDYDGLVCNFWRAVQADPDKVAHFADWPVNECVPAGTIISTPSGEVPVENVLPGMLVWGERDGWIVPTRVLAINQSTATELHSVGPLQLTGNHPVWTQEQGYVQASQLTEGLHIAMICKHDTYNSVRDVRENVQAKGTGRKILLAALHRNRQSQSGGALHDMREAVSCASRKQETGLLLAKLRPASDVAAEPRYDAPQRGYSTRRFEVQQGGSAETLEVATVSGQSDLRSDCTEEGPDSLARERLCSSERGTRESADCTSAVACRQAGMANRSNGEHSPTQRAGTDRPTESQATLFLRHRHRRARSEDRHRGGRQGPYDARQGKNRCAEGRVSRFSGVDSFEVHEQENSLQLGRGHCRDHGGCKVYNFQTVTGNYFANQILVHNCDLTARHVWLVERKDSLQAKLEGDPDYFDPKIAGYWCWGLACWIGSGFCSGKGPWGVEEVDGVRKLVHLGSAGQGVNRQLVHLGNAGRGVNRQLVHLGSAGQGVNRRLVAESSDGKAGRGERGLLAWMQAMSERLRRVRVCCGDWTRVCGGDSGDAIRLFFVSGQTCAVFLDPPYSTEADRYMGCYRVDSGTVAHAIREWAIRHGDDERLRIILCGYEGEHKMPASWRVVAWKAQGGMGNLSADTKGRENCKRERLWLSPHCLDLGQHKQAA